MKRFFSTPLTMKFLKQFLSSENEGVSVRVLKRHHISRNTKSRV